MGKKMARSNNEYYGVTKISKRGLISIPKKARDDLDISPGTLLVVLAGTDPHSTDAFMILKAEEWYKLPDTAKIKNPQRHKFYGTTKITERGQIVIPKKLRDEKGIANGFQVLILSHKITNGLVLALLNTEKLGGWADQMLN